MKSFRTFLSSLFFVFLLSTAQAATIEVNTTSDEDGASVNTSSCSLREAIYSANQDSDYGGCSGVGTYGDDVIIFSVSGPFVLDLDGSGEDTGLMGDLDISGNLSIEADDNETIEAAFQSDPDRVFHVSNSANLTLQNLTVTGGHLHPAASSSLKGAGLYVASGSSGQTISIDNVTFSNNELMYSTSVEGKGGVIYIENTAATLTITDSTFDTNNIEPDSTSTNPAQSLEGGMIYSEALTNTISDVTFENNTATSYFRIIGGLMSFRDRNPSGVSSVSFTNLEIHDNTVTNGNTTSSLGLLISVQNLNFAMEKSFLHSNTLSLESDLYGGLINVIGASSSSADTQATVKNSIFANNTITYANTLYGGSFRFDNVESVQIEYSTFAYNTLQKTSSASTYEVYGASYFSTDSYVELKANIFAENTTEFQNTDGDADFQYDTRIQAHRTYGNNFFTKRGHTFYNPNGVTDFSINQDGTSADPNLIVINVLNPLVYIDASSPAKDINTDCTDINGDALTEDYRGLARDDGACDSGAVEYMLFSSTDSDGDGYGDESTTTQEYSSTTFDATDCDDGNANVYPGAPLQCNGEDNDCNGTIDDDELTTFTYYIDADNDGTRDPERLDEAVESCESALSGYTTNTTADCDDNEPSITDEDAITYYNDADGDGYGNLEDSLSACTDPGEPYVTNSDDCDDSSSLASPDITVEDCSDELDNDCNGTVNDTCSSSNSGSGSGSGSGSNSGSNSTTTDTGSDTGTDTGTNNDDGDTSETTNASSGGGGCQLNTNSADALPVVLSLLLILPLVWIRNKQQKIQNQIINLKKPCSFD